MASDATKLQSDTIVWNTEVKREVRKEMLNLTLHSTHFIYGYMASDIW